MTRLEKAQRSGKPFSLSRCHILAGRDGRGYWSPEQLRMLGLDPARLPRGWVDDVVGRRMTAAEYDAFLKARKT